MAGPLGVGGSREDLIGYPVGVRKLVGKALWEAQIGGKLPYAKPLKGFGGASVIEIVADERGNAFRVVYTIRFAGVVYVLHAFKKKSIRGRATPKAEIDLIRRRLKRAEEEHDEWLSVIASR